jgi:hypothetical protein
MKKTRKKRKKRKTNKEREREEWYQRSERGAMVFVVSCHNVRHHSGTLIDYSSMSIHQQETETVQQHKVWLHNDRLRLDLHILSKSLCLSITKFC